MLALSILLRRARRRGVSDSRSAAWLAVSFCRGEPPVLPAVLPPLRRRLPPIPSNAAALRVNGPVFSYYYLRVLVSDHRELRSLQPV